MKLTSALLLTALAAGCSQDSCKQYSRFTCKQLEKQTFNVYYYDKDKRTDEPRELYAGAVIGLQQCGAAAWDAAAIHAEERSGDWSYVCCLQTSDSSCAEKHR